MERNPHELPEGCKRLNYDKVRGSSGWSSTRLEYVGSIVNSTRFVIHPLSHWKLAWDWLIIVLVYVVLLFAFLRFRREMR